MTSPPSPLRRWLRRAPGLALLAAFLITLGNVGLLDAERLRRAARNLLIFVGGLFPPDPSTLPTLSAAMLETIQIAKDYEFLVLFTSTPGFPGDMRLAKAIKSFGL
jgi:ABC-type phosphate/phosphonate transport system permease subunit